MSQGSVLNRAAKQTRTKAPGFEISARLFLASATVRSVRALSKLAGHAGGNLPGELALKVAPHAIGDLCARLGWKAVVTGTNGKTTTTNLARHIATAEHPGVVCNRGGDNMTGGIATALLSVRQDIMHASGPLAGIFEMDELYTSVLLHDVDPQVLVLLNLSRDQLDRYAEMEMTQQRIAQAVLSTHSCALAYCADDPLCQGVADLVAKQDVKNVHKLVPFGFKTGVGAQTPVDEGAHNAYDGSICSCCGHALSYDTRFFGQCGSWHCNSCGHSRTNPVIAMELDGLGVRMTDEHNGKSVTLTNSHLSSASGLYDLCAAVLASGLFGWEKDFDAKKLAAAVASYTPENGRDEEFLVDGVTVVTKLAKNPVGMDAAISSLAPSAVAFALSAELKNAHRAFYIAINDRDADGHDVSWLWDSAGLSKIDALGYGAVLLGGSRKDDLAVRLHYGGMEAGSLTKVESLSEAVGLTQALGFSALDVIGNYTAFADMVRELKLGQVHAAEGVTLPKAVQTPPVAFSVSPATAATAATVATGAHVHLMRLFPDALDLYGDSGNAMVLERRLAWRGISCSIEDFLLADGTDDIELKLPGILTIGGGSDSGQLAASAALPHLRARLDAFLAGGGVILAICGGYQLLGRSYVADGDSIEGLGLIPMETVSPGNRNRIVGHTVEWLDDNKLSVVGFENHAGRTRLDDAAFALGKTNIGRGNDGEDQTEGFLSGGIVGTYLHGPVLSKNPALADALLLMATGGTWDGKSAPNVDALGISLDNTLEMAAHDYEVSLCD